MTLMDASTEVHPAVKVATIVGYWSSNETRTQVQLWRGVGGGKMSFIYYVHKFAYIYI